jgi:hypothetical protein
LWFIAYDDPPDLINPLAGVQEESMRTKIFVLLGILPVALLQGCAPVVRLTVEQRNPAGNVNRFTKTNSDSGPTSITVSGSDVINLTAEAEHKDGLQALSIIVSGTCSGPSTVQNIGFGLPASGNAIPAGSTPSPFSFSDSLGTVAATCPGTLNLDISATATSAPTSGLFSGGPATSSTQPAQLKKN